ncbi:MAG: hypothetical protein ACXW6R_23485 [Candidatus Binatia bacterium]
MSHAIATIVKGGIVLIPLLLCSLISLALTTERLLIWGGSARRKSLMKVCNGSRVAISPTPKTQDETHRIQGRRSLPTSSSPLRIGDD